MSTDKTEMDLEESFKRFMRHAMKPGILGYGDYLNLFNRIYAGIKSVDQLQKQIKAKDEKIRELTIKSDDLELTNSDLQAEIEKLKAEAKKAAAPKRTSRRRTTKKATDEN